jgi:N-acyl-D-amino-acid deacylase
MNTARSTSASGALACSIAAACCLASAAFALDDPSAFYDLWIRNGQVYDGTGAAPVAADVLVRNDRIARVGEVQHVEAARTIDAAGRIVAPGFIDLHSHGDPLTDGSFENFARQGITTVLLGQDGRTPGYSSEASKHLPLPEWMDRIDAAGLQTNVAALVGHGSLRRRAGTGVAELPTAGQTGRMHSLMREGLEAGAFGMSSGLEYVPGRFARTAELVALAAIVGDAGGVVMSHLRSEDSDQIAAALDELLAQGGRARVHVSHLKIVFPASADEGDRVISMLEAARARGIAVTADAYPYLAGYGDMSLLYPPWAKTRTQWDQALATRRPQLEDYLRQRIDRRGGPDAILLADAPYTNETLGELASELHKPVVDTVIDVLGFGGPSAAHFNMRKDVQDRFIAWQHTAFATDGGPSLHHPRSWGTYPKVLEEYVRKSETLGMADALRKMTGLPASIIGLPERGTIREGSYADLVIFSPQDVRSTATWSEPAQAPVGIDYVIVNGCIQVANGGMTANDCGRLLRDPDRMRAAGGKEGASASHRLH